jgi:hypothetical protein
MDGLLLRGFAPQLNSAGQPPSTVINIESLQFHRFFQKYGVHPQPMPGISRLSLTNQRRN